jgi:hypothetical protein
MLVINLKKRLVGTDIVIPVYRFDIAIKSNGIKLLNNTDQIGIQIPW